MWLTIGTKEVTKAVVEATRERLLIWVDLTARRDLSALPNAL